MRLTNAMMPTPRTGQSMPLRYAGWIATMSPASIPANIVSKAISNDVAVHVLHFLLYSSATVSIRICNYAQFYSLSVDKTLRPTDQAQYAEALWLNDEGNVESLHHCIGAERDSRNRPDQHHRGWKTFCALGPIVSPYLGCQLHAPTHGADRA
jgi:hypothetical protein